MAVVLLAAAGLVVSVASVWVWQGSSWNWTNSPPRDLKGEAREQYKAERRNAYFYSLDNNAIAHNLRRMTQPSPFFPLQNLCGGPNPLGLLALATAGLAPLAAWLLARERDPPPPLSGSATPERRTGRPHVDRVV